jgi:hypothetical protein
MEKRIDQHLPLGACEFSEQTPELSAARGSFQHNEDEWLWH